MTEPLIRDYEEGDRPGLILLVRELQAAEAALHDRMKPPADIDDAYVDALLSDCAACRGRILVAATGTNLVGYAVVLTVVADESFDEVAYSYAHVQDLAVTQGRRSQGLGSRLLARCETIARDSGARWLRVDVLARNAGARRLYDRAGFRPLFITLEKPLDR